METTTVSGSGDTCSKIHDERLKEALSCCAFRRTPDVLPCVSKGGFLKKGCCSGTLEIMKGV